MKTAVLEGAALCTGSILHIDNNIETYGQSGPSALVETTDSILCFEPQTRTAKIFLQVCTPLERMHAHKWGQA